MLKKIIQIILLSSLFVVVPKQVENSKIINERHQKEELGEYGDTSKVTLASDRTNVLIRLSDDSLDNYTRNNYPLKSDFKTHQRDKFNNHNNNFIKKLNVQYDDIYISKYSPYVEFSYNSSSTDKLNKSLDDLVKHDFVEEIYIQDDYKPAEMLGGAKYDSGTSSTLISTLSGGEDIKIGLLEYGICDKSNPNLTNSNITCRDEWYFIESKTEHATLMASIIVGSTGMAPNAHLYSVQLSGNPVSEVDWLIDKDISVCNVSIGDGTGSYSSSSSYLDYAANTYGITFCCATGNGGDDGDYVSNFSLANNCIAVGAGDETAVSSYTSTLTPSGQKRPLVIGPDTVAVSDFDTLYHSGTSVATAVCTGVVALIQQYDSVHAYSPHYIRALLMANCKEFANLNYQEDGYYLYGGAGRINLQNCIDNYSQVQLFNNYGDTNSTEFYTFTKTYVYTDDVYRTAVSYSTRLVDDVPTRTNYGLRVFDAGNRITFDDNDSLNDSFEFLRGVALSDLEITFSAYQNGTKPYSAYDILYVAYRVIPSN